MIPADGGGFGTPAPPKRYAAPYSHPNANNSTPSYGNSGGYYTGNNGGYNVPGPNVSQRYYGGQTHITGPSAAQIRAQQGQAAAADARTAAAYAKSLQYNKTWPDQFTTGPRPGGSQQPGIYNPLVVGPGGKLPDPNSGGPGQASQFGQGLNGSGINLPNINTPTMNAPSMGGPSGGGPPIPGSGNSAPSPGLNIPRPPKAPGLDAYLKSDAAYQNQLRTFAQALAEFQAGQTRTTAQDNTSWQGATRQLGDQRTKDLAGIMNDFASRGMLKSGLYGQNLADYARTYNNNLNDLNTGHSNALRDLSLANTNFQKDQAIQEAQARADAAARRAAQFGL
jgi:hypothetical protein